MRGLLQGGTRPGGGGGLPQPRGAPCPGLALPGGSRTSSSRGARGLPTAATLAPGRLLRRRRCPQLPRTPGGGSAGADPGGPARGPGRWPRGCCGGPGGPAAGIPAGRGAPPVRPLSVPMLSVLGICQACGR